MAREYLPKLAIAILTVSVALVILSSQPAHVAALPTVQNSYTLDYHHHWYGGSWYWSYYYYYPYYYSYYYPYNYYSSSYCPSNNSYSYGYPYYYGYSSYYYSGYSTYCTPSSYTLTVATDPSNLGTTTGGGSYTSGSSASFSVTQNTVQVSSNTRYVFDHWSGDYTGTGTSASVTVNNAMTVTAVYDLQYYLTVNAQPSNAPAPQGGGWFNSGDTATVQNSGQTVGDSASRLNFQGWSVDGAAPQSGSTLSLVMNAPHTATAVYGQQYYLNVQSDQGVTSGSGWYDAGSTAQFSVSTPISTQYGVSIVFNGWTGDVQSSSQSSTAVMNGPTNVVANWRTDSTVLYLTIAAVIIAAVLIVVGVVAFVARGRGNTQSQPPQITQPAVSTPPPAQANQTNTTHKTESHRRKTSTTEETEQPSESGTTE
jgi:hypothetical protein